MEFLQIAIGLVLVVAVGFILSSVISAIVKKSKARSQSGAEESVQPSDPANPEDPTKP